MAKDEYSGVTAQRKASHQRRLDAEALLASQRWLGAMYLAGYAVECLLKAKLMQRFRCLYLSELERRLRDKRLMGRADTIFSHQLHFLLRLTGALDRLRMNREAWLAFTTINEWVPAWRYFPRERTQAEAHDFCESMRIVLHWIDANI